MKFIIELVSRVSCSCALGTSTLDHKVIDYPVKSQAVIKRFVFLSSIKGLPGLCALSQSDKIIDRYRSNLLKELNDQLMALEVNLEFDDKGKLLAAKAAFAAGAGLVGFPGFITESVLVDEGTLQLVLEPESGDIVLQDSSVYVGGSRASLNGRFSPTRNDDGKLESWRYNLAARNVSLDTQGTLRDPLAIDSFSISSRPSSIGFATPLLTPSRTSSPPTNDNHPP